MLINWPASILLKLGENLEALTWFENALTMAKAQGDPAAEKAICKAIDDCHIRIAQEVNAVQGKKQPFPSPVKRKCY